MSSSAPAIIYLGMDVHKDSITIADQHTRFLVTCHGVRSTHGVLARPVFERAIREYGRRARLAPTTASFSPRW